MISLTACGYRYAGREVLRGFTAEFEPGEFVSLTGPNGAGKSTLLGVLAGLRREYSGSYRVNGKELREWPARELARWISAVPQSVRIDFPFTVEELVLMGRTPHGKGLYETGEDFAAAADAMHKTDTLQFRDRDVRELSAGERQRVLLASALAQQPRVLLLDEPATFLDLEHQLSIYGLLRSLSREGLLIIAATHDLHLAGAYSSRVLMLANGSLHADGTPAEVLTPSNLAEIFHVAAASAGGRVQIRYGE